MLLLDNQMGDIAGKRNTTKTTQKQTEETQTPMDIQYFLECTNPILSAKEKYFYRFLQR